MRSCPSCGRPLRGDGRLCPYCGEQAPPSLSDVITPWRVIAFVVIALAIALPRIFHTTVANGGSCDKALGMLKAFGVLAAMLPLHPPSVGLPQRPSWRGIAWSVAWRVAVIAAILA